MFGLANYNQRCAPPLKGLGWDVGMYGLAATPAAARQAAALAKRTAAAQKRTAAAAVRKAKRDARVAGRNVKTSNPGAASAMNAFVVDAQRDFTATMSAAKAASARIAAVRAAKTPQARAAAQAAAQAAVRGVATRAGTLGKKLVAGGAKPIAPSQAMRTATALKGLGVCDPSTGFDADTGMPCDASAQAFDPYAQGVYAPQQVPATPFAQQPAFDPTGLTPGFGTGLPNMFPQTQAPRGCNTGSNLPRCLIYQMAQDEQQQFYFVFSILQQMYAQLLSIVQQLMQQLQYSQQYGQQQPGYPYPGYGPTGQPYGQDPYAMYGGAGPYGQPGIPYYPGGDTGMIPAGYDAGGDPFGGGMVPTDMTQIFPGPAGGGAPQAPGPSQPAIISSDSLPDGAGPSTGSEFGDESAPVPAFQAVAPLIPQVASSSQPVSAGPGQPNIVVQLQMPGQSSYADAGLPGGENQLIPAPSVESPGGGQDEWAREF